MECGKISRFLKLIIHSPIAVLGARCPWIIIIVIEWEHQSHAKTINEHWNYWSSSSLLEPPQHFVHFIFWWTLSEAHFDRTHCYEARQVPTANARMILLFQKLNLNRNMHSLLPLKFTVRPFAFRMNWMGEWLRISPFRPPQVIRFAQFYVLYWPCNLQRSRNWNDDDSRTRK